LNRSQDYQGLFFWDSMLVDALHRAAGGGGVSPSAPQGRIQFVDFADFDMSVVAPLLHSLPHLRAWLNRFPGGEVPVDAVSITIVRARDEPPCHHTSHVAIPPPHTTCPAWKVCNVPTVAEVVVRTIKGLLPKRTREAVFVFSTGQPTELREKVASLIDLDQVPRSIIGSCDHVFELDAHRSARATTGS
jgi:hypothetical protein